jgi:hypothetical protein
VLLSIHPISDVPIHKRMTPLRLWHPAHCEDWTHRATDHLLRRRPKQREADSASSLGAHDDEVRRFRLGRAQDLAMRTPEHDNIINLNPRPRFFRHQFPQPVSSVLGHIAPILGNVEVG